MMMTAHNDTDILFEFATEGILVCDATGNIIRINPAASRLFGYEREELLGQAIEILVPESCIERHRSLRSGYHQHPEIRNFGQRNSLAGRRKNGTEFPVEVSLSPYQHDGRHYVIAFVVDITFRRQSEDQLRLHSEELQREVKNRTLILEEAVQQLEKTKQELNAALIKERELSLLKSRFVTIASHEFRTPLATILTSLSLVRKYADMDEREKRDKHIDRIKSSIGNLNDILDDFLSLSRLEEGVIESEASDFELDSFIHNIVDDIRPAADDQKTIAYHHSGEGHVHLDMKALKTIMVNLIGNALKYSERGRNIEIESEVRADRISIVVRDHGIGIPEAEQVHIFERFYRAHNVMHIKGTGLGLSIVAKFVELMNGHIVLQSKEHEGTTVTLTFTP